MGLKVIVYHSTHPKQINWNKVYYYNYTITIISRNILSWRLLLIVLVTVGFQRVRQIGYMHTLIHLHEQFCGYMQFL